MIAALFNILIAGISVSLAAADVLPAGFYGAAVLNGLLGLLVGVNAIVND